MSYSVTKQIDFCYGHRLLNYSGKCRNLHGHNGRIEIRVETEKLDELGMVVDFGDIKKIVKVWVDEELDHKMILNEKDPLIPELEKHKQPFMTLAENPTAEAIAKLIFDTCRRRGLPVKSVRLWETPDSCALYSGE